MATRELIVSGFVNRHVQSMQSLDIPQDIITLLILFYPQFIEFDGNTVDLTNKEKEIITEWFIEVFRLQNKSCTLSAKLLYDYNKDGKEGEDFYEHCVKGKNTFSIVRTNYNGHVFGCFLSKPLPTEVAWSGTRVEDDKAFLCVIRSSFEDKSPELFKVKQDEDHIKRSYICFDDWGPCFGRTELLFLSAADFCEHPGEGTSFQGNLRGNTLCGGDTFIGEDQYCGFEVINMTTFEINIESA